MQEQTPKEAERVGAKAEEGQLGGHADGAPFGAGWEARKFPPRAAPLPVKWEAGSCTEGRGKQRRGGWGLEGEQSR